MLNNKTFLAIIPARGGSKRLLNKNILDLSGKPLIYWSINASLNSKYIDKTLVSTDSEKIIEVALSYGAEVPFKRPSHLSNDHATKEDVINHAIDFLEKEGQDKFDYIVYLQPTSPLRNEMHIDGAIEYIFEKKADAAVSVSEVGHPTQWSGVLPDNKNMNVFINNMDLGARSQDLPVHYKLNGAIYICNTRKFIKTKSVFLKENLFAYVMPQIASIDIDSELDFIIAKAILDYYSNE